jgi:hypothetical protein
MALRAHAGIGEDLRDGIAGGGRLFMPIRFAKGPDVIEGVIVRDELESVGYAVNDVLLPDHGHGFSVTFRLLAASMQFAIIDVGF